MLFLLTNHNGDDFLARNRYQEALQSLSYQLSNFTAWVHGSQSNFTMVRACILYPLRWLISSTLKPSSDSSIPPLVESHMTFGSRLDPSRASYFQNVTGFVRGDLAYYNLSLSSVEVEWMSLAHEYMANANTTQVAENGGAWNWATTHRLSWSVSDRIVVKEDDVSHRIAMVQVRRFTESSLAGLDDLVLHAGQDRPR